MKSLKVKLLVGALAAACALPVGVASATDSLSDGSADSVDSAKETAFTSRVVATGLENPWEVISGPDGYLWVTEKSAGRVTRVRPSDGAKEIAVTIPDVLATSGAQDGLLGMALHPKLLKDSTDQYVYVAYTYDADTSPDVQKRKGKIVRYTYNRQTKTMVNPVDVISGLPATNDHVSGRLAFGPDQKLYYTSGDGGANQFANYCNPVLAQRLPTADEAQAKDWSAYHGKILRLNLDGSVPSDNPRLDGVRSHVYTYGHRNSQGIAFTPDGRIYASEQGPKSDDELNLIEAGGNYGWPNVAGYQDDQAYVYGNWSASQGTACEDLTYSDFEFPDSVPQQKESDFTAENVEPLKTFHTVPSGYDFRDPQSPCAESGLWFICWPTVAPSSLAVYSEKDGGVPGWGTSLLMPTLKDGTVYRLPLSDDGQKAGEPVALWHSVDRYRDVAIDPNGTTFYAITDKTGVARSASGEPTFTMDNPGSILEYTYADGSSR